MMPERPGGGRPASPVPDRADAGAAARRRQRLADLSGLAVVAPYLILTGIFTLVYLAHPALPGNNLEHPLGWWGWWDQSLYLRSAQALGRLVLSPDVHWYPLGYSLLGAPWTRIVPTHPFFFVNLLALLGAFFCFLRIGRALGVRDGTAAFVFIAAIATDGLIFWQFVIPWNTTPVMLYVYLALAVTLREAPLDVPATVFAALCAALVLVTRPSDMPMLAPVGLMLILRCLREAPLPLALGRLAAGAVAAGVVCGAYAALHFRIYGVAPSPYMAHSGAIGLNLADLPRKLYAVLLDPRPFYGEGQGLLQRAPWILLAVPGLALALVTRNRAAVLVAAVVTVNILFYAAYTDFLPHGIWRYNNIHYLKTSYPLLGLLAVFALARLRRVRTVAMAAAMMLAVLAIEYRVPRLSLPARAIDAHTIAIETAGLRVETLVLDQAKLDYKNVYFDENVIQANGAAMRNIFDFRSIPVDGRVYVVFFRTIEAPEIRLTFKAPHGFPLSQPVAVDGGSGAFGLRWPRWP